MKDLQLTGEEIKNAIGALFTPALDSFSVEDFLIDEVYPKYLQDVENFSNEVLHFDEYWCRFSKELQSLAEERGVGIVVKDEMIELKGSGGTAVTFTLCNFEEDVASLEIDFSELDGMTRDEAIEYLEALPAEIEPFGYVTVNLSYVETYVHITTKVIAVYPDSDMLGKLFDCFDKEEKTLEDAERKAKRKHAKLVKSDIDSLAGTKAIVEGLKALGWTGKYVVEKVYSGFILMILLDYYKAARIGGSPEEIVKNLPDFLSFCKDYPDVENPKAYFVRCGDDSTIWKSL